MSVKGRPRKAGERFACGKLKPETPAPNERTVAIRRALLGAQPGEKVDLSKAENALDVALERGWLSIGRHIAAKRYADLYRAAGVEIPVMRPPRPAADVAVATPDPSTSRSGVETYLDRDIRELVRKFEAGEITEVAFMRAERKHRAEVIKWGLLPAREVAAIWDAAMALPLAGRVGDDDGDPTAAALLRAIWLELIPAQAQQLHEVCILGSWPQWVIWRAAGKEVPPTWDCRRIHLEQGLDVVARITRPPPEPGARAPQPSRPNSSTAPKVEEHLRFVDEDGHPVPMLSEHGKPFEVVRRRAR